MSVTDAHEIGINDPNVEIDLGHTDDGMLTLRAPFTDSNDPTVKAIVSLEIDPEQAIDLVDRIICELAEIGVTIRVGSVRSQTA